MRNRVIALLMCAVIALGAVSCYGDLESVKHISLNCKTTGFVGGGVETSASWNEGEKIHLFRADDWTGGPMSLVSGAGSKEATFVGDMTNTRYGYYAVRPRSAAGEMRLNGSVVLSVEPNNIFFAEDNSSIVVPQIGEGKKRDLTFKSCFGALKFNVENINTVSSVQVSIPGREHSLYGTFAYYFKNEMIVSLESHYELMCNYKEAVDISASQAIYVALPVASRGYDSVSILVTDGESGKKSLYTAEEVQVVRGCVTDIPSSSYVDVPVVVGSWRIKSYCGSAASVDLYIEFTSNNKFTILQRSESAGYTKFTGTYSIDKATSTLSGVYSDGEPWSNSYKYSLDENLNLVLTNAASSAEVSVYEPSEMPKGALVQTLSRVEVVKPL